MTQEILYFECFSGISGDMVVGALLDIGADKKILMDVLNSINYDEFDVKISAVHKSGIKACDFDVVVTDKVSKVRRNLEAVNKIIDESSASKNAKSLAKKMLMIIATAQANAHGRLLENVKFHEAGAVDTIVDILSAAVCIDNLGIENIVFSTIYEGIGTIECNHVLFPVPVPAVTNIVSEYAIPIKVCDIEDEMITPTGAAIAAALSNNVKLPEKYRILKTGIGAGKGKLKTAGLLRVMRLESAVESGGDYIWVLETNIDDSTGEMLGNVMEILLKNGARDAFYTPVYMKKNRPAYKLEVVCDEPDIKRMESIIFRETTTIGIRRRKSLRTVLKRNVIRIDTEYGDVLVKVAEYEENKYFYPEFESVRELSLKNDIPYKEMFNLILCEVEKNKWKIS